MSDRRRLSRQFMDPEMRRLMRQWERHVRWTRRRYRWRKLLVPKALR